MFVFCCMQLVLVRHARARHGFGRAAQKLVNESHAVIEHIEVEWPSDAELDLHAGCG